MKIKVITGFRDDQYYTIDAEEAHMAYRLFENPEERAIFANGVALIGKNIQGIEPNWQATMGWNETHKLDNDDWNEIRSKKLDTELRDLLQKAKEVAYLSSEQPELLHKKLSEAILLLN